MPLKMVLDAPNPPCFSNTPPELSHDSRQDCEIDHRSKAIQLIDHLRPNFNRFTVKDRKSSKPKQPGKLAMTRVFQGTAALEGRSYPPQRSGDAKQGSIIAEVVTISARGKDVIT